MLQMHLCSLFAYVQYDQIWAEVGCGLLGEKKYRADYFGEKDTPENLVPDIVPL